MVNYTQADVVAMQNKLGAISPNRSIIATSLTGLFVHGVETELHCLRFDCSATLFAHIVEATGATVTVEQGVRQAKVDVDTWIREGTSLVKEYKDGVWVYPLDNIRMVYEIQGESSNHGLRDHARAAATKIREFQDRAAIVPAPPPVVVTPAEMGLSEEELAYSETCSKADWYYSYSDDIDVWRRGRDSCNALKAIADSKGGNYARVYKYHSSK